MLRHGGIAMLASIINLILRLIRIKLLATYLGPVGLGQIGLLSNFIEMVSNLVSTGFAGTLNRELARQKDNVIANALISAAAILMTITSALFVIPAVILFYIFSNNLDFRWFDLIIIVLAILTAAIARFTYSFYFAYQLSGRLLIVSSGSAFLNLLFVAILLYAGYEEPILFAAAAPVFLFIVSIAIIGPYLLRSFRWQRPDNSDHYHTILRMALPIVFTTMLTPTTLFYLRSYTDINLGPEALGMIQPGLQLVALITLIFSSFAGMTIVRWDQSKELGFSKRQIALLLCAIIIPTAGIIISFSTQSLQYWVIKFLFSVEFLPSLSTIPYFISGELCRISGFLLNQTFISKGYNWYTVAPKLCFTFTVIFYLNIIKISSIIGVALAYFYANFIFALISFLLFFVVQYKSRRVR